MPAPNIAYAVTLATGDKDRLGKSYIWSKLKALAGFEVSGSEGEWQEDGHTAGQTHFTFFEFACDPSLRSRHALRTDLLAEPGLALVNGVLNSALRDKLEPFDVGWRLPERQRRNQRTLVDAPRAFLTVDIDKLDLSAHCDSVFEVDGEIPDILANLFDSAGLDWLIADCVMALSSSHGVRNPRVMSAHIDYHLREPLSLAAQKCVAHYINERMWSAGICAQGHAFCDPSLYEPARLMFTAPVQLRQRVDDSGKVRVVNVDMHPIQRVRYMQRGQGTLDGIPDAALSEIRRLEGLAHVRAIARKGYGADRALGAKAVRKRATAIAPGHVHGATIKRALRVVMGTPRHRMDMARATLSEQLKAEVLALPDNNEPRKLEQRLREVSGAEFDRAWRSALELRYGRWRSLSALDEHDYRAAIPVDVARATLSQYMQHAIGAGLAFAHVPDDPSQLIKPLPRHTLIPVPPGLGKTESVFRAIQPAQLMTDRIAYLTPNIRLSEEAATRMRGRLPADEYTQSRVRHHKGRDTVCKQDGYRQLASKIEKLGISPVQAVCAHCPRNDVCPWPAQQADKDSGLVFGQHAHATTALAKIRKMDAPNAPAVGIVDESMLGTLLRAKHAPQKLASLRTRARKVVVRTRDGNYRTHATNDTILFRVQLLDALEAASGAVSIRAVDHFRALVSSIEDGQCTRIHKIDAALRLERETLSWYSTELKHALDSYHEATAAGRSRRRAERRVTDALAHIKVVDWFLTAYRCIKGSLGIDGRAHVFGLRISGTKHKHATLQVRAELPLVMQRRNWLWLDGTADPTIWRALVGAEVQHSEYVGHPVQHGPYKLYQYADRAYSRAMFASGSGDSRSNLARLRRFIETQARQHARVLVVCQIEVERRLVSCGLPTNVHTEHFNDLRGIDAYRDVPCAIIVGRAMPSRNELELMTEALYYDDADVPALATADASLHLEERRLRLDTSYATIRAESHHDPKVRAMQRQIVDAEVKQALHRLRLFDRVAPAELHVFGQVDTGLIVTELRDWCDADYDAVDMALAGGIISSAAALREHIFPGVWRQQAHALIERALQRGAKNWPEYHVPVPGVSHLVRARINPARASTKRERESLIEALLARAVTM